MVRVIFSREEKLRFKKAGFSAKQIRGRMISYEQELYSFIEQDIEDRQ